MKLLSESECWFAPGLGINEQSTTIAETLHASEAASHAPNSIDLFEDEAGKPLLIYFTAGATGSTFILEKSHDLKTWEAVDTVASSANVVPFLVTLDEKRAFFRIKSR